MCLISLGKANLSAVISGDTRARPSVRTLLLLLTGSEAHAPYPAPGTHPPIPSLRILPGRAWQTSLGVFYK